MAWTGWIRAGSTRSSWQAGGEWVLARADRVLVDWVRAAGATSRRVTSVCSGVFLLAAAGLVTEAAATHWDRARQLADEHPELIVDCDPIFIRDGRVWTSAGVSAGMDLALALVEDDLGQPAAHAIAQELVLFLRRPGTQSQFSVPLWSAQPSTDPIKTVVAAVQAGGRAGTGSGTWPAAPGSAPVSCSAGSPRRSASGPRST